MSQIDAKKIYLQFKRGDRDYSEEIHCPMILNVMNEEGTAVAFMKKAFISKTLFYRWLEKHKLFKECYEYGKILSKANWEEEGERGKDDEYFNFDQWRLKGSMRYGVGRNCVRMGIDEKANPYKQYQQLIKMANEEEFNASEIKQLMESINVGIRAFESHELQEQINMVKKDINKMENRHVNNFEPIEKNSKTD